MKRILLLLLTGLFLSGCGTMVAESEYTKHSSHYATWEHLKYSWFGYQKPTPETLKESQGQDWWGIPTHME
ncbi:MAG: hypothetical protein ABIE47_01960 [Pseudomonadota bacterium]